LAAFKKTKESAVDFGKQVEDQGMKMSEMFGLARKGALGLVGAFVGGEAASFINHVIGMDAATGRMAKTIGTSVTNLSAWQYMIRQVGGEASSATSALSALQQEIESVRQGGGMFEGGFASLMNQAGVSIRDDADTSLRKIQQFISGQIGAGKMRPEEAATFLRRVPGMNQDMLNLLLGDFKRIEQAAKDVGTATKDTADAAGTLQAKFSLMIQAFERFAAGLIPFIELLMKPVGEVTKTDVAKGLNALGGGLKFEPGSLMDRLDTYLWGEYGQHSSAAPSGGAAGGGRSSAADREAWIRSFAAANGIDPDMAMRVARSEGFGSYTGDQGTSFGDFQLHLDGKKGQAVGDAFKKQTGLDPSDPANEKAMDQFALQWAAAHGWSDFHGAARVGVGQWGGIGAKGAAAGRTSSNRTSTSTSEVNIGKIDVNAPNATDADGIANEIGSAMKRQSLIAPANYGLV
jgi:hypothetical protein